MNRHRRGILVVLLRLSGDAGKSSNSPGSRFDADKRHVRNDSYFGRATQRRRKNHSTNE